MKRRFAMPDDGQCTLAEVAAELGVSPERARQVEANALRKCRRWAEKQGLSLSDLLPFREAVVPHPPEGR